MINELNTIEKEFLDSLENIISYIDLIEEMKTTNIDYMKNSKFYKSIHDVFANINTQLTNTKTVQYNAIIISLYGAYELAIKKSSNIFIRAVINNNFSLSTNLLKNYILSVAKTFERNTDEENGNVISELNSFLNNKDLSKFRMDLSLNANQNLKTSIVQQIASLLDIKNVLTSIKHSTEFELYIKNRASLSSIEVAKSYIDKCSNPFQYIDDIVESRNRIAHMGYEENMLDNDMVKHFVINEFKIFVTQYINLLKVQWCNLSLANNVNMYPLQIIAIYNKNIICFNTGEFLIDKKSIIFIRDANDGQSIGEILSIQCNNQDIVVSGKNQNIGCKLDLTCKEIYEYYLYYCNN